MVDQLYVSGFVIVEIVVAKNVVVVDSPTGRPQAVRRGRTGGLRPGRVLFEQGLSPFEAVERDNIHGADHFGS